MSVCSATESADIGEGEEALWGDPSMHQTATHLAVVHKQVDRGAVGLDIVVKDLQGKQGHV